LKCEGGQEDGGALLINCSFVNGGVDKKDYDGVIEVSSSKRRWRRWWW